MGIKDWAKKTVNAKTGNPQAPSKAGGMSRDKYLDDEAKHAAKKESDKATKLANAQGEKADGTTGSKNDVYLAHEKAVILHKVAANKAKLAGLADLAKTHETAAWQHVESAKKSHSL